ncbi:MAG: LON peptidase substrate-binding domain-containing protein [Candidatus Melainabacteria bacterium]|nr:LON peptidase substrate-binding domain-containing protein [Candidatus Melainabacteria bacterium]
MALSKKSSFKCPVFLLPGIVLFPGMDLPLHIFEDKYKDMVTNCIKDKKLFGVVYTKGNLCADVGTLAEIISYEELGGGKYNLLAEGKRRFKILDMVSEDPYYEALVEYYDDKDKVTIKIKESIKEIKTLSKKALKLFDEVSKQKMSSNIKLPDDPNELLFLVAANLSWSFVTKLTLLETISVKDRVKKITKLLHEEVEKLEVTLENKKTKPVVETNGHLGL